MVIKKYFNLMLFHNLSLFKSLYFYLKGYDIAIFKKTNLILFGELILKGKLQLGFHWKYGLINPSCLVLEKNSKLIVDGNTKICSGFVISVHQGGSIYLNNVFVNSKCNIDIKSSLKIGKGSVLAENLLIRDNDGHNIDGSESSLPITIGKNVWVGNNVLILKGVVIGDNSIIAAGSVVNKSIPENSLAAGNPCVVKKSNARWF